MSDTINRQDAIDAVNAYLGLSAVSRTIQNMTSIQEILENLPSVEPERLTDDDFETIRIHLNALKERLCNQRRWEEAEEYQRIIDRFMAFASAPLYTEAEIQTICQLFSQNRTANSTKTSNQTAIKDHYQNPISQTDLQSGRKALQTVIGMTRRTQNENHI